MGNALHKVYGGLRLIQVCRDWPKWFREYVSEPRDERANRYRLRNGAVLHTRRNGIDLHMIDEIWAYRKYDYFGSRVRPGDVVVDIGANIGTFAVYAATACRASRVICFEPDPKNFAMLRKNVESNGLEQVTCVPMAVADHRGTAYLELSGDNSACHALGEAGDRSIEVECCTLQDVFDDHGIDRIDYLKMDCEGGEYDIFAAARKAHFDQIGRISMEYHVTATHGPDDLKRTLSEHGFRVVDYGNHRIYAGRD